MSTKKETKTEQAASSAVETIVIRFWIGDINWVHDMKFIPPIGMAMQFDRIVDENDGAEYRLYEHTVEGYRWFDESDVDLEITLSNDHDYM